MIRVGVAGWSYDDWDGIVYPARKPARFDRLAYLAGFLDTLEINSTFYRIPETKTTESWARRVKERPDFRFTAKLFQGFTHKRAELRGDEEAAFKKALKPLSDAGVLGAVLAQFPYSFRPGPASRETLEWIIEAFGALRLIVEIRHADWDTQEFYDFLRERSVGFCNLDQPRVARSIGPTEASTSPVGYVRLHGRNAANWFKKKAEPWERYDYAYAEEELTPWVPRIRRIAEQTADVFIIANNHYRGKAPLAALTLLALLRGEKVAAPAELVAAYPQMAPRAISKGSAQGQLF
ncbi:MAG: DUF72 domain-containing protein [Acidobacteria bacterium]|nr:DUF72 domain-containing protein [Acidobacteriota bacterium]